MSKANSAIQYCPHKRKADDQSSVWHYFLVASQRHESAKCKQCGQILLTKGGSTKGLHTHLKQHNISVSAAVPATEIQNDNARPSTSKQVKLTECFEVRDDNRLNAVLSRMTAVDGFAFSAFTNSKDLRRIMHQVGYEVPKSPNTIKDIVIKEHDKVRDSVGNDIKRIKAAEGKFSVVLDEWTSTANKHFLNVFLCFRSRCWNIGLIRFKNSFTAEVCVHLLRDHLASFEINLEKDVVAMTTDGASTMVKAGRLVDCDQQLCLAHGLQLAVIDVLYKKEPQKPMEQDYSSDSDDETDEPSDGFELYRGEEIPRSLTTKYNLNTVIDSIRKIVRIFRKSPTKNDQLQSYVKADQNKELKLVLDCKTRWSSLLDMLERFILLENPVKKALIDLKIKPPSDTELEQIKEIIRVLQPVKITVEALCSREMNLYRADVALNFMLNEIKKKSSTIGKELHVNLLKRIKQRRTANSNLLAFLSNANVDDGTWNFDMPDISIIKINLTRLLQRLHIGLTDIDTTVQTATSETTQEPCQESNLKLRLKKALDSSKEPIATQRKEFSLSEMIIKEIDLFKNGGQKGRFLQKAYDALVTIQPTSVESERCFSNAGFLCNKFRSRLEDKTLNALVVLRSHFKTQNT